MDDVLVAVRAVVSLAAVLGLLLWLRHRIKRGQTTSPQTPEASPRLARLTALLPTRSAGRPRASRPERINVVTRAGLGGKAQLVVAEFGGIRYILGVTEHGINVVDTQETVASDDEAPRSDEETGRGNRVEQTDGAGSALKSVA
jgi:flagellar protein FliO/FliZ